MPILLNKEIVANEVMELARLKIAAALKIPPKIVDAEWKIEGGLATPSFTVDLNRVEGMTEDTVRQTLGATWRWLKGTLSERMEGLKQRRG